MNAKEWKNKLLDILKRFAITNLKNYSIYVEAFTHSSYANEKGLKYDYERLEFLGDSAINWIFTNYLYRCIPKKADGDMSIIKSKYVSANVLAYACKDINLTELIFTGNGMKTIHERVLCDVFESFVGAVAQDQGIKKVINILNMTLIKYYEENLFATEKDYKTQFQELIQASQREMPNYVHSINKDVKISKLYFQNQLYGIGEGANFREADQIAAKNALEKKIEIKD